MKGRFNDYRDSAIYGTGFNAGIPRRISQTLHCGPGFLRRPSSSFPGPIELRLEARAETVRLVDGGVRRRRRRHGESAPVSARRAAGRGSAGVQFRSRMAGDSTSLRMNPTMSGFVADALPNLAGGQRALVVSGLAGSRVESHRTSRSRLRADSLDHAHSQLAGVLKLSAQLAAVGPRTAPVRLQVKRGASWHEIAQAPVDLLARNAAFRIPQWDRTRDTSSRVVYRMDRDHNSGRDDPQRPNR